MKMNYVGCSHNKIFKKPPYVYKFFKSINKYENEKQFYIKSKNTFSFIPELCAFSDYRKLLVLSYCGERISKQEFLENKDFLKVLHDLIVHKTGYYHRDLYYKNILKNKKNQYFIIDFESCSKENNNIHKRSKEIYIN